jgi:hypothetical protein
LEEAAGLVKNQRGVRSLYFSLSGNFKVFNMRIELWENSLKLNYSRHPKPVALVWQAAVLACLALPIASQKLLAEEQLVISKNEIVTAIDKAKILAPGISVNADVSKDHVSVSTYRNSRANDDDIKIEAALIAKTVLELAPKEIARVSVFFFSAINLKNYREVAVTAGDIKAFSAGATNEKQLISSLKIIEPQMSFNERQLVEEISRIQAAKQEAPVVTRKDDEVDVVGTLDSSQSAGDYELEAFKMARKALEESDPAGIRVVKLTLKDPAKQGEIRTVTFNANDIKLLSTNMKSIFDSVEVAVTADKGPYVSIIQSFPTGKIDIDKLVTAPGEMEDERQTLLFRIRDLSEQGVGVKPFLEQYVAIEEELTKASAKKLAEDIATLSELLDKQELNLKISKEFRPIHGKNGQQAVSTQPSTTFVPSAVRDLGTGERDENLEQKIVKNPDGMILYFENELRRRGKSAEDHPRFLTILDFFSSTLRANNRPDDAAKFEARAKAIRARHQAAKDAAQSNPQQNTGSTEGKSTGENSSPKIEKNKETQTTD